MYDAKHINAGVLLGLGIIVLAMGAARWRDHVRVPVQVRVDPTTR